MSIYLKRNKRDIDASDIEMQMKINGCKEEIEEEFNVENDKHGKRSGLDRCVFGWII